MALASVGPVAAQELSDVYTSLQGAVNKKDVDAVAKLSGDASKMAKASINSPQPSDAAELDAWKKRVEYSNEVNKFASYALSATAMNAGDPAKTVALVDQLIAQDPKSEYLDTCAGAYLAALQKTGGKQSAGATKILAGRPDNIDALYTLAATGNLAYANRLVAAGRKPKPEGVAEAEWEREKTMAVGRGLYFAGVANVGAKNWVDCDKDLKEALPYLAKEPALTGNAYFYLGLANYTLGKLVNDRAKMTQGEKYTEQSAAIAGPMQSRAAQNVTAMKTEMAGPAKR